MSQEFDKRQVGERLRVARKRRGLSRPELAELLSQREGADVPSGQQRIANYELGYNEPSMSVARYLCEILQISEGWLDGRYDHDFDPQFEKITEIYQTTDDRGRKGIFTNALAQPILTDRDDEADSA